MELILGGDDLKGTNGLEGLATTTPSGDTLFKKPFGDSTSWKTPNGSLTLKFVFDNMATYDNTFILSSLTGDWAAEMRRLLTKKFLDPSDIVPENNTLEDEKWELYQKMNPRIMAMYLEDPQLKAGYAAWLVKTMTQEYKEEELLTKALQTRSFRFLFRIAIDAYPQNKHLPKDIQLAPGERQGVLTFCLEGRQGGDASTDTAGVDVTQDEKNKKRAASPTAEAEEAEEGQASEPTTPGKKKKSKKNKQPSKSKSDSLAVTGGKRERSKSSHTLELEDVLQELDFPKNYTQEPDCIFQKEMPNSAVKFFDEMGIWFNSALSFQQHNAEIRVGAPKSGLYQ
eukprot:g52958.t1